jgi:hypothetical protein
LGFPASGFVVLQTVLHDAHRIFSKCISAHALHLINPTAEFKGLIVYSILCDMTSWDYRSYLNYNIA